MARRKKEEISETQDQKAGSSAGSPRNEAGQAGLPATYRMGAGMETLGSEDLIIPRLVLVQPTSQIDGVEAGKFYLNLTGEQFNEVEAVFLRVTKGRVIFMEDANERKPVCGSSDRIRPSHRFDPPMAPSCGECAYSRWNGKEPPPCNETYNLLGVMVESGLPFWWSVKSTAIAPTKRFISAVALRARMGKNLYDAEALIKSQLVTLPGKKYHVPVYAVAWLKDSSLYRELYEHYAHEEIDRTFVAEEAATTNGQDFDWQTGEEKKGDGV